jgi:hypothetical protein
MGTFAPIIEVYDIPIERPVVVEPKKSPLELPSPDEKWFSPDPAKVPSKEPITIDN